MIPSDLAELKCNSDNFQNASNAVLREIANKGLNLTFRGWVDKNPATGKHEGHIFVVDNEFRYYLKWETKSYQLAWLEVNQKAGYERIPRDSRCRVFSVEKFDYYMNPKKFPGGTLLFMHSIDNNIWSITCESMLEKSIQMIQSHDGKGEEVMVIQESDMKLWGVADAGRKQEKEEDSGPNQVQGEIEHEPEPKDLDLTKTVASEPKVDNPEEVYVADVEEGQSSMDSFFMEESD